MDKKGCIQTSDTLFTGQAYNDFDYFGPCRCLVVDQTEFEGRISDLVVIDTLHSCYNYSDQNNLSKLSNFSSIFHISLLYMFIALNALRIMSIYFILVNKTKEYLGYNVSFKIVEYNFENRNYESTSQAAWVSEPGQAQ